MGNQSTRQHLSELATGASKATAPYRRGVRAHMIKVWNDHDPPFLFALEPNHAQSVEGSIRLIRSVRATRVSYTCLVEGPKATVVAVFLPGGEIVAIDLLDVVEVEPPQLPETLQNRLQRVREALRSQRKRKGRSGHTGPSTRKVGGTT